MAALGDWPWHAALLKEGVHVCDATVVHPQWLLTSASCFQGYVGSQIIVVPITLILAIKQKKIIGLLLLSYFGLSFCIYNMGYAPKLYIKSLLPYHNN